MKKDFAKIIKKNRQGGKFNRKGRKEDFDHSPKIESMRKKSDRKTKNIVSFEKIKRFLNSKIGKSWDKTWKEICSVNSVDNFSQNQLREFVFSCIFVKNYEEDGKIYSQRKYYGKIMEIPFDSLYVCPSSGIIKKYKQNKAVIKKPSIEQLFSYYDNRFELVDGNVFKISEDSFLKTKIYQKITKNDVEAFYSNLKFNRRIEDFCRFLGLNKKSINLAQFFIKELDKHLENYREELEIKKGLKVGDKVEIIKDFLPQIGTINRVEYLRNMPIRYFISIDTKNVSVIPEKIRKVVKIS